MINKLDLFRRLGKKKGFEPIEESTSTEEGVQEDRKLVQNILPVSKKVIVRLKVIENNNKAIASLKRKQMQAPNSDEGEKGYSEENRKNQRLIKDALDQMRSEVAKAKEEFKNEPEWRVIVGVYSALMIKFKAVLREFQESQLDFKNTTQDKIKRQIAIIKPEADEDEINALAQDPEAATSLLNEQIMGTAHMKIRNAVGDIDQKYKDILRLEKGVEEVYQLFLDLETLIAAQGEMLDSILTNMQDARDYVKKGNKKLESAMKYHKTSRNKLCLMLIVIVVILVILILLGGGLGIGLGIS